MLKEIRPAVTLLLIMIIVTGLAYPMAVTGLAQLFFPSQANGSLIEKGGKVIGSALIGQAFSNPAYFNGRPSAAGTDGYDAAASSGSNLAPSSKPLAEAIAERVEAIRAANPGETGPVPADLATASASGLDPHISPEAALYQIKRVAAARAAPPDEVRRLVDAHTEGRDLGFLGERKVNLLKLNLALDAEWPMK